MRFGAYSNGRSRESRDEKEYLLYDYSSTTTSNGPQDEKPETTKDPKFWALRFVV